MEIRKQQLLLFLFQIISNKKIGNKKDVEIFFIILLL